jgi:D-proline reductase (dithiol) PrdB
VSLIARYLEENGIPTVVIAAARDIVEHCGVARMLFVDFPLGNPCGEPGNVAMQRDIVEKGLQVLETATEPRTIVEAGLKWSGGDAWKKLVFTEAQPFLSEEAESKWTEGKQTYRQLREEGKV